MKNLNRYFLLFLVMVACGIITAKPRSEAQMRSAAESILKARSNNAPGKQAQHYSITDMSVLSKTTTYSIFGYENGPFVVVSADDKFPAVLGYADRMSKSGNPGFRWWLRTMEQIMTDHKGSAPLRVTVPDTDYYPASVDPLCTAMWGQEAPFNDMTPIDPTSQQRCVTGCVATAMAQLMYYHRWPEHGHGSHSITYNDQTYTFDYDNTIFDWDNMLDSYANGYNNTQAKAVATLMYGCGVATDMIYDTGASGAVASDQVEAMKQYFGYKSARLVYRSNYRDTEWMNMIYDNISEHNPILYNGIDEQQSMGHAFVLDGYNEEGMVHINWGWNGDENGYFFISALSPSNYTFSSYQSMIINIQSGAFNTANSQTVTLTEAGTLSSMLTDAMNINKLIVKGPINADDIMTLREMAGRDKDGRRTEGNLMQLDLSEATLDELPEKAFYGCVKLRSLILPNSLRFYGDGALAGCTSLREVSMPAGGEGCNYVQEEGVIYNTEKNELIAVLPSVEDSVTIAEGVTSLHDYAMKGCNLVTGLYLPSTLTSIGREAIYGCYGLRNIRSCAPEPPILSENALSETDKTICRLYVFGGSKRKYQSVDGWKDFVGVDNTSSIASAYDNIIEFGTTVTARDAIRNVGEENPHFGYKVEGVALQGRPELKCDATVDSPAGVYPIIISRGTITNEQVVFVNGKLNVIETTGINSTTTEQSAKDEATYNISGQRINQNTADGIIIKGGKKYVKAKR